MSDIIQLLPDSVANQIAAGEVIQRPASVVKEMVENSIDAGATKISINVKDAGRTLIQITDNGKGMSATDARMSFERHATSKIRKADDLFAISTMGFRGEALASIAAVAEVELKTRQEDDELGTHIVVAGSEVQSQEATACDKGTNFMVKNLFFNIPARRKFLKSNRAEMKHIITEVQRIALANPEIGLALYHNGTPTYDLPAENLRKRIVNIFGRNIKNNLIPVETETSIIAINGYIGQPKFAKKRVGEQFFFVNGRFMKHAYFHKAVTQAYEGILPADTLPAYFLNFTVDPDTIDVNIHPTKTEIKFEDEGSAWHIIHAAIREALGKHNVVPSIEFDQQGAIDIPLTPDADDEVIAPSIEVTGTYNPFSQNSFDSPSVTPRPSSGGNGGRAATSAPSGGSASWENIFEENNSNTNLGGNDLYAGAIDNFESEIGDDHSDPEVLLRVENEPEQQQIQIENEEMGVGNFLHFKGKYILTPVKSGLMMIDQRRAHERILYENFLQILEKSSASTQKQLFPQSFTLNAADAEILHSVIDDLALLGLEIEPEDETTFSIVGVPGILGSVNPMSLLEKTLNDIKNRPVNVEGELKEYIAKSLARNSAINYGTPMRSEEVEQLFNSLFFCKQPTISPSGKPVLRILNMSDLDAFLR